MSYQDRTNFLTQTDALDWLFNNEFLADVHFEFNDNQIIYAHSLILATRSSLFHAQLQLSDTSIKVFCMPESNFDHYKEFLKFIYTNDCDLTNDNYQFLMKMAEKHTLHILWSMCNIFNQNLLKDKEEIPVKLFSCLSDTDTIAERFSDIIKSDEFLNIDRSIVQSLVSIDVIDETNECKIFDAIIRWAEFNCRNKNIPTSDANIRKMLKDVIKYIRFQFMTTDEFASCIAKNPGLLKFHEISDLLISISLKQNNTTGFSTIERKNIYDMSLAQEHTLVILKENSGIAIKCPSTRTIFKVSHRILLASCWVWAHAEDHLRCKLYMDDDLVLYEIELNCYRNNPLTPFNFDKKIVLIPDRKYTLELSYEQPNSTFWCRENPPATPFYETEGEVTFEFLEYGMNILRRFGFKKIKTKKNVGEEINEDSQKLQQETKSDDN